MLLPRFSLQEQIGRHPLACILSSSDIFCQVLQHLRSTGWPRCCHIAAEPSDFGFPSGSLVHCKTLDLSTLRQLWDVQKELVLQLRLHELPVDYDTRLVLAIDCAVNDFDSFEMRELVRNCRNYHTLLLLRVRTFATVPTHILENSDVLVLAQPQSDTVNRALYTRFCQSEITFAKFEQALKDYNALVIQPRAVVRVQSYGRVASDKT